MDRQAALPADPASLIPADRTSRRELADKFGLRLRDVTLPRLGASPRTWSPYAELLCALDMGPPTAQDGSSMLPALAPMIAEVANRLAQTLLTQAAAESGAVADIADRLDAWDMHTRVLAALLRAADHQRINELLRYADSPGAEDFLTLAPTSAWPTDEPRPTGTPLARLLVYGAATGAGRIDVPTAVGTLQTDIRALGAVPYAEPLNRWLDAKISLGLAATPGRELREALASAWHFRGNDQVLCDYADWQAAEENREQLIARIAEHNSVRWQHARDNLLNMVLGGALQRLSLAEYATIQTTSHQLDASFVRDLKLWMKKYPPRATNPPSGTYMSGPARPQRWTPPRT